MTAATLGTAAGPRGARDVRGRRAVAARAWRWGLVLAAAGLAFLPWLAVQCRVLWGVPHYQFLPLVPLVAGALLVRDRQGLGVLTPGAAGVTLGLLGGSFALTAGADLVYSPTLGTAGALVGLAALAQGAGGRRLLGALAPTGLVLLLLLRPPLALDTELTYRLQTLATGWSSRALDTLGVFHLATGHVLEVPGRRLYVEGACSGITSLFVLLAVTLCGALWFRRGAVAVALLLAAAAAWVLLANVARIVAGVYALSQWGFDITSGRPHEALGLLIVAGVLGLVASTDRLIAWLLGDLRRAGAAWSSWRRERRRLAEEERTLGLDPPPAPGPTCWPEAGRTWVGSWPVVGLLLALGLANVATVWRGLVVRAPDLERRAAHLSAADLPAGWGALRLAGFHAAARGSSGAPYGVASWRWEYRPGGPDGPRGLTLSAGVDAPFVGWHEATDCYRAQGWLVDSRRIMRSAAGDRVLTRLTRPEGGAALLVFAFDDARGRPLAPPAGRGWRAVLAERLAQGGWRLPAGVVGASGPAYQMQLLFESHVPASPEDEGQALALFDQVRGAVRRRLGRLTGD